MLMMKLLIKSLYSLLLLCNVDDGESEVIISCQLLVCHSPDLCTVLGQGSSELLAVLSLEYLEQIEGEIRIIPQLWRYVISMKSKFM